MSDHSSMSEEDQHNSEEVYDEQEMSIEGPEVPVEAPKKLLEIQQNEKDSSLASFVFHDENHTLGNALRYMISKTPETEFCGYSIPHHSENKMVLRVQCVEGVESTETLKKGLVSLQDLCVNLRDKLDQEIQRYTQKKH